MKITNKKPYLLEYATYSITDTKDGHIFITPDNISQINTFEEFCESSELSTVNYKNDKLELPSIHTFKLEPGFQKGQSNYVYFLMIDADKADCPTRATFEKALIKENLSFISYFSSGHFKETFDKYRIIIPLSEAWEVEEFATIKKFYTELSLCGISLAPFDEGAIFRRGKMYLPGILNENDDVQIRTHYGDYLDISEEIKRANEIIAHKKMIDKLRSEETKNYEHIKVNDTATQTVFNKFYLLLTSEGSGFYNNIPKYVGGFMRGGVNSLNELFSVMENVPGGLNSGHKKYIESSWKQFYSPENVGVKQTDALKNVPLTNIEKGKKKEASVVNLHGNLGEYLSNIEGIDEAFSTDEKIKILDAPTNFGKTYFALHNLGKTILAVPYKSIVEKRP